MKLILITVALSTILVSCASQRQCGGELSEKDKKEQQVERQKDFFERKMEASSRKP